MKNPSEEMELPDEPSVSFFDQPGVSVEMLPIGAGVPFGIKTVANPAVGIGGAYGSWGQVFDNLSLPEFVAARTGTPLGEEDRLDLTPLGFDHRHHVLHLTEDEHRELELQVGERYLRGAMDACGWAPEEVDAVLIGLSAPALENHTEEIARRAGIPDSALKVTIHKACDSSMGALHLTLNPALEYNRRMGTNLADTLLGKKVLVGGIEGLSRFLDRSRDLNGLQLFGNGAGVIGVIPGETMRFLVGKAEEVYDDKGMLAVQMWYPHSRRSTENGSLVDISQLTPNSFRLAGMMHEPDGERPLEMAGLMGMVKLFVRSGVEVVQDVYASYQSLMAELGAMERSIRVTIAHHANFKINKLKAGQLAKVGIHLNMPWLLRDFGNVSAASNMIAFLRALPDLIAGDDVLFDGFGAGTYYDVFAVSLAKQETAAK